MSELEFNVYKAKLKSLDDKKKKKQFQEPLKSCESSKTKLENGKARSTLANIDKKNLFIYILFVSKRVSTLLVKPHYTLKNTQRRLIGGCF